MLDDWVRPPACPHAMWQRMPSRLIRQCRTTPPLLFSKYRAPVTPGSCQSRGPELTGSLHSVVPVTTSPQDITPFRIDIPQDRLDDLNARLAATQWPDALPDVGWSHGIPVSAVQRLAESRGCDLMPR
jgi:hypothetical protein